MLDINTSKHDPDRTNFQCCQPLIRNLDHEFPTMRTFHGITYIHRGNRHVTFLAVPRGHLPAICEPGIYNCWYQFHKTCE